MESSSGANPSRTDPGVAACSQSRSEAKRFAVSPGMQKVGKKMGEDKEDEDEEVEDGEDDEQDEDEDGDDYGESKQSRFPCERNKITKTLVVKAEDIPEPPWVHSNGQVELHDILKHLGVEVFKTRHELYHAREIGRDILGKLSAQDDKREMTAAVSPDHHSLPILRESQASGTFAMLSDIQKTVHGILGHVSAQGGTTEAIFRDQSAEIAALEKKNRKLTSMVVKNAPSDDRYSASQIRDLFKDLQHAIKQIPHLFPVQLRGTDRILGQTSDTQLCAHIGIWLHKSIFGDFDVLKPRYGLSAEYKSLECCLREAERYFGSFHVDPKDVKAWVLQTFSTMKVLQSSEVSFCLDTELHDMVRDLYRHITTFSDEWSHLIRRATPQLIGVQSRLSELISQAARLALILRSCRVDYRWRQNIPCHQLVNRPNFGQEVDTDVGHDVSAKLPESVIVFGPVFTSDGKNPESESLLMKGTAMFPPRSQHRT